MLSSPQKSLSVSLDLERSRRLGTSRVHPWKAMPTLVVLWGVFVLNVTLLAAQSAPPSFLDASRLEQLNLTKLESRLTRIDARLQEIAKPSMRMGHGAVGYRSKPAADPYDATSIQIRLDKDQAIDQIVLVPEIWRDTKTGFRADGFPLEFQILAGTANDKTGTLIASYTENDHLLPRVAPLIITCPKMTASWVRLEATKLSRRAWDNRPILQLAEILVFSGKENVALRQEVDVTSDDGYFAGARYKQYLVDGFVPYLMDAQQGEQSVAYVSLFGVGDRPELVIDLESVYSLNRIHLHSADSSDTVPQSVTDNFGVSIRLLVEGAMSPDFSDAVELIEYQKRTNFDVGPMIMRRFPATRCRYVRLTAVEPYTRMKRGIRGSQIGFAEIELFSHGRNVARGKKITTALKPDGPERLLTAITDGHNLYGQILPTKSWLGQLALRHDLEVFRPSVTAELQLRYHRQHTYLTWLLWLAGFLAVVAIVAVLVGKISRERAVARTREQIAADLHDELGANFHAIGLLSDVAQANFDSPDKLRPLMARMRDLTQRAGMAASYCANMLESEGLFEDLEQDMRRSAGRLVADLQHDISLQGQEFLNRLSAKKRIGVLLFYKESLTNIIRHSEATQVVTDLKADANRICLKISDNGHGLADSLGTEVPGSLKRRARLLGAKVSAHQRDAGGTRIELLLRTRPAGLLRIFSGKRV